jgi:hypothetical protein
LISSSGTIAMPPVQENFAHLSLSFVSSSRHSVNNSPFYVYEKVLRALKPFLEEICRLLFAEQATLFSFFVITIAVNYSRLEEKSNKE